MILSLGFRTSSGVRGKKCIDIYKLSGISMSVCIGLRISLQEIVVFTQKYRCASSQPNLGHSMIIMIISSCLVDFIEVISSLGYSTKWTFKIVNLIWLYYGCIPFKKNKKQQLVSYSQDIRHHRIRLQRMAILRGVAYVQSDTNRIKLVVCACVYVLYIFIYVYIYSLIHSFIFIYLLRYIPSYPDDILITFQLYN